MNTDAYNILELAYERSCGHYRKFLLEATKLTNLEPKNFKQAPILVEYVNEHRWSN